ncbi:beta strand repeat-containing protein [Paludibaculum fermentans]|uniref:beta strand repeat-containing protein n=1 Tax=Paludibaculum fermentans TaxID=1473598 RepID=UPI003EB73A5B
MRIAAGWPVLFCLAMACTPAHAQQPRIFPERWVYVALNPGEADAVAKFQSIVDTAAGHGLTGIVLNGSFDGNVWNSPAFKAACAQMRQVAAVKGLEIIPAVFALGYGAGKGYDPNLMEGLPVNDQLFVVNGGVGRLVPDPAPVLQNPGVDPAPGTDSLAPWAQVMPGVSSFVDRTEFHAGGASVRLENFGAAPDRTVLIRQWVQVRPNRVYRLTYWTKSSGLKSDEERLVQIMGQDGRSLSPREDLTLTRGWTKFTMGFNSWNNTEVEIQAGVWLGTAGQLWLDDFQLEEVGLTNVLRRPGAPLTVKSEQTGAVYTENVDFGRIVDPQLDFQFQHEGPVITIPAGSRIQEGERLRVSYYHGMAAFNSQVSTCMSEEAVYDLMAVTARNINDWLAPKRWLLFMDELRAGGTCDACRRRGISISQMLADSMLRQQAIVRAVRPDAEFITWSDMFDPYHNARPLYYLLDGDLTGVADLLPKDLKIIAWEPTRRKQTLPYFDSRGFRTMAASYYDTGSMASTLDWLSDLYATPGADGIMYTTWARDYSRLAEFGDLVSSANPSTIPVQQVALNPATLQGGVTSITNTVTLSAPAPANGAFVALHSSNAVVAAVPLAITVPAGMTSASFTVASRGVAAQTVIQISATAGGVTTTADLTVLPVKLASLAVPALAAAKVQFTGMVTIDTPAPPGGIAVNLTSSNPAALPVPASVSIATGSTTAQFKATSAWPGAQAPVVLTAQAPGTQQTANVLVVAGQLSSLTLQTPTVGGTALTNNRVTLTSLAAAPVTVNLASSSPSAASVPASVVVPAGASSAVFPITSTAVSSPINVNLTAELDGVTRTVAGTIQPAALNALVPGYAPLVAGVTATGVVSLNGPAGPGGASVALSSADPLVLNVPANVLIPAGKASGTFSMIVSAAAAGQSVALTASYLGVVKTATAQIIAVTLKSITVPATAVSGTLIKTSSVTLSGPAPTGGIVVALSSSDPAAAAVPASVTVPAGASTAAFNITTVAGVSSPGVTITASANGVSRTGTLQLTSVTLTAFSAGAASSTGGLPLKGTITLGGPAPAAGVTVALQSSNTAVAPLPASVLIAGGTSSATFNYTPGVVLAPVSVTLSASYGGITKQAALSVLAPALKSLTMPLASIGGRTSTANTVAITGPAPAAGAVIGLTSSNPAAVPVPLSVTIPAGASSATFSISPPAVTTPFSVTITANYGGASRSIDVTIQAAALSSLSIGTAPVTGGVQVNGLIGLTGPAPAGGLSAVLTGTGVFQTLPSSVTIPAGGTLGTFSFKPATTAAPTSIQITVTLGGITKSSALQVLPPVLKAVTAPAALKSGQSANGTLSLTGPATAGGVVVSLSDSSGGLLTMPASVTFPAGSSLISYVVKAGSIAAATTATITATQGVTVKQASVALNP